MTKGSRFAVALILFWLAFTCFYVAFHPGGIVVPGANPKGEEQENLNADGTPNVNGAFRHARNPSDVIAHVVGKLASPDTLSQGTA